MSPPPTLPVPHIAPAPPPRELGPPARQHKSPAPVASRSCRCLTNNGPTALRGNAGNSWRKRHQLSPRATLTAEAAQLGKPQNTTRTSLGVPWRPGHTQHPPGPASRCPSPPGPPRYQNSSEDPRHAYGTLSESGGVIKQHARTNQRHEPSVTDPTSRTPASASRTRITSPRHGPHVRDGPHVTDPESSSRNPHNGPHVRVTDPTGTSRSPRHGPPASRPTSASWPHIRVIDPARRTPRHGPHASNVSSYFPRNLKFPPRQICISFISSAQSSPQ